jgi:hypothetical protein
MQRISVEKIPRPDVKFLRKRESARTTVFQSIGSGTLRIKAVLEVLPCARGLRCQVEAHVVTAGEDLGQQIGGVIVHV